MFHEWLRAISSQGTIVVISFMLMHYWAYDEQVPSGRNYLRLTDVDATVNMGVKTLRLF